MAFFFALVAQGMENIRALTHSLKGGAGTLRMSEVYLKISDLEAELGKDRRIWTWSGRNFPWLRKCFP